MMQGQSPYDGADGCPLAGQAWDDDIAALRAYLGRPSFRYVDQAVEEAHAEALARWPLLRELDGIGWPGDAPPSGPAASAG